MAIRQGRAEEQTQHWDLKLPLASISSQSTGLDHTPVGNIARFDFIALLGSGFLAGVDVQRVE
jgi:hypothetical protein